jgi:hypothetical protein
MGFGGGGGGALPNHEHTNIALDGGPLDFVNTTIASLANGDMTYSDGAALQALNIGVDAQVLGVAGGAPTWITNTSNPLVKVTKTFSDIAAGSMAIYTLPQDAALVNIWADITTVFDLAGSVTIGDPADANGFQEATDWTASTGLTDATRGAYVINFKTMRSTSGTTAISAYSFGAGTTFTQSLTNDAVSIGNFSVDAGREELAQQMNAGQVLVGENIASASWYLSISGGGSPDGDIKAFIRQADGTLIAESSTVVDADTITALPVKHTFDFPNTTLAATDMITISGGTMTAGRVSCDTNTTEMTNGILWESYAVGTNYVQLVANQMKMEVEYALNMPTQGEVDFYLQVVD